MMPDPAKKICPSGLLKSIAQETAFFEAVFTFLIPLPGFLFIMDIFQTKGFITRVKYLNITSLSLFYSSLPAFTINFRCVRSPPCNPRATNSSIPLYSRSLHQFLSVKLRAKNALIPTLTKAYKKRFMGRRILDRWIYWNSQWHGDRKVIEAYIKKQGREKDIKQLESYSICNQPPCALGTV